MTGKYGFENSNHIIGGRPSLSTLIWFPAFLSRKMLLFCYILLPAQWFDGAGCLFCVQSLETDVGAFVACDFSSSVEEPRPNLHIGAT